jgi:hypothetical protein
MRKLQKAAVVVAMLGSVGVLGAGTASAHGDEDKGKDISVEQNVTCKTHDLNLNIGNGNDNTSWGGLLGNEGDNGTQDFTAGSTNNCSAEAF